MLRTVQKAPVQEPPVSRVLECEPEGARSASLRADPVAEGKNAIIPQRDPGAVTLARLQQPRWNQGLAVSVIAHGDRDGLAARQEYQKGQQAETTERPDKNTLKSLSTLRTTVLQDAHVRRPGRETAGVARSARAPIAPEAATG